jgi:hypothetical protein
MGTDIRVINMDAATGQKIDEAKDEVKKTVIKWSLGLTGIWAQGANLTAVFLICFLFYQYQRAVTYPYLEYASCWKVLGLMAFLVAFYSQVHLLHWKCLR